MTRSEVEQHIFDTLGKILVDKSVIQEQPAPLMSELFLDDEDFNTFFTDLHTDFDINLPSQIKSDLSHLPDNSDYRQLTLQGLVDLILVKMEDGSRMDRARSNGENGDRL
ncbi:hypothetical protein ACIQAL_10465 [Pseudomonas sp. NPDC088368]|jgi:hypothetical protein|uniref:hypothetical protein n=1 Tax=Pseudomonas sp. NPDC088368 TaxID=3364453 RepID=UPI00383054A9